MSTTSQKRMCVGRLPFDIVADLAVQETYSSTLDTLKHVGNVVESLYGKVCPNASLTAEYLTKSHLQATKLA